MIKAVITDIDSTLYSHSICRIPDSALQAIEQLHKNGVKFYISTGRHLQSLMALLDLNALKPDGLILMNGSQVIVDNKIIHSYPLDKNDVNKIIEIASKEKFAITLVEAYEQYASLFTQELIESNSKFKVNMPKVKKISSPYPNDVYQIICIASTKQEEEINKALVHCKTTRWDPLGFDILPKNSSKASGIEALVNYYHWSKEEILSLGDQDNDIEMLRYSGIGVAMGNATKECKMASDYITDNIDKDGWAKALKHFGVIK